MQKSENNLLQMQRFGKKYASPAKTAEKQPPCRLTDTRSVSAQIAAVRCDTLKSARHFFAIPIAFSDRRRPTRCRATRRRYLRTPRHIARVPPPCRPPFRRTRTTPQKPMGMQPRSPQGMGSFLIKRKKITKEDMKRGDV